MTVCNWPCEAAHPMGSEQHQSGCFEFGSQGEHGRYLQGKLVKESTASAQPNVERQWSGHMMKQGKQQTATAQTFWSPRGPPFWYLFLS
mmetsp:Transcript_58896/g.164533  ORF Transcript_58896/g.164533 Transcript_58896/m.164533 type:complete len:89 (+) Transcript_58896:878-1144(+)